jgi:anti-anti-sigma factor
MQERDLMMNGMTIKDEIKGDVVILRLSGHLDAVSAPTSECKMFEFINNGQIKLLVDLAGVQLLSSAGMRMLVSVTKKLKSSSGNLILTSVSPAIRDVLKMSGCFQVLEIANTVEDGLRKF